MIPPASAGPGASFTWLGFSSFIVRTPGGKTILIDPWVENNPACPEHLKRIERCDLILVTHAHRDHLGDAVPIARDTGAPVVAVWELGRWLEKRGVADVRLMNKGGSREFDGVRVTMVHADHSCGLLDGDQIVYAGEAAGYVVRLEDGFTFYHAGDTNVFGDMSLIGELYRPRLALLPIGGVYTMSPYEAAHAVRLLGVRHVVPMHYGTLDFLTGRPDELRALASDVHGLVVHDVVPGGTVRWEASAPA